MVKSHEVRMREHEVTDHVRVRVLRQVQNIPRSEIFHPSLI